MKAPGKIYLQRNTTTDLYDEFWPEWFEDTNHPDNDICGRILYGVKFTLSSDNIYTMKGIDLIVTDEGNWEYAVTAKGITPIEIKYIKLYLRPMSSMTEEEEIYYNTIYYTLNFYKKEDWLNEHHFDYRGLIPMGLALEAPKYMYKQ